jgi:hypothetical protein
MLKDNFFSVDFLHFSTEILIMYLKGLDGGDEAGLAGRACNRLLKAPERGSDIELEMLLYKQSSRAWIA